MNDPAELTINQARSQAAHMLREAGIDTAALDARVLMAHVLDVTPTGLLLRDPEAIGKLERLRFRDLVEQRSAGIPVAYLIGHREFMGLQFKTAPGVLVPRPDTEPLVEWGLEWMNSHPEAIVVDIGTGSGAIAISLAAHADPGWTGKLIATDVSEEALAIATSNADFLLTPERKSQLQFVPGSLTEPLKGPVDLLVTNLPYLTPDQMESNPALRHEPSLALDGGADGLDLVRRVISDLPRLLTTDSAVGFEIDPSQAAEVQRLLAQTLPGHTVSFVYDLAGDERHVVAQFHPDSP